MIRGHWFRPGEIRKNDRKFSLRQEEGAHTAFLLCCLEVFIANVKDDKAGKKKNEPWAQDLLGKADRSEPGAAVTTTRTVGKRVITLK